MSHPRSEFSEVEHGFATRSGDSPSFNLLTLSSEDAFPLQGKRDASNDKALIGFGLPAVDLSGFEREAPHQSEGALKDLWHGLKHVFVKDETWEDKIRRVEEDKMTNTERRQYERENEAMERYNDEVRRWGTLETLNPPPFPKHPICPMHQEIDRRVQAAEDEISAQVCSEMSPFERVRLDRQLNQYEEATNDRYRVRNPLGTGEGFAPLPEPGNAVKDYYDRIAEATEGYLSK